MKKYILSSEDIQAIRALAAEVASQIQEVASSSSLELLSLCSHELPRSLRSELVHMKLEEEPSVFVISGYLIDDEKLGLTPEALHSGKAASSTLEHEIVFLLMASLLGEVIGWSTQQAGRIVHDVFPIKSHAHEQIGTGSEQPIWWHTEDAFHQFRGDYVGLMCLRNPDQVATTVCMLNDFPLSYELRKILFQPHFTILPDDSHRRKNAVRDSEGDPFDAIEESTLHPVKVAVLEGAVDSPYIRMDPYFMIPAEDRNARDAMMKLVKVIDERIQEVILHPGDICFVDNYRAVHGRKPFKARYDGYDRWLKRINITRDLRKSRSQRKSAADRVIY